jgi:colanic acid/amylovoran biosynthesis protein
MAARRFAMNAPGRDLDRPASEEPGRLLRSISLLAVSGAGNLCDSFLPQAWSVLRLLEIASFAGVPTALFSQGLGPIENRALRAKARSVLPLVDLIGIRERRTSLPLLEEFGVPSERIHVTGDDAIELAYRHRAHVAGACLGVNLRVAYYSSVDRRLASSVLSSVAEFARMHGLPVLPVPVSFVDCESDLRTVSDVLGASGPISCPAEPAAVVGLAGRCRMVVTGSYHGAVFALAQGIPAVALTRSRYYANKFLGLADMFGAGCDVVDLSDPGFPQRLLAALGRTLETASGVRDPLLQSARRQIAASRAAYRAASECVSARRQSLAHGSVERMQKTGPSWCGVVPAD